MLVPGTFQPSPLEFCGCSGLLAQLCQNRKCPFLSVFMHKSNIWPILLQHFVGVDSHVTSNSHFSIFFIFHDWQGLQLMVIPLVSTLYPILPAHLPVYPQGHPFMVLPVLLFFFFLQEAYHISKFQHSHLKSHHHLILHPTIFKVHLRYRLAEWILGQVSLGRRCM